MRQLKLSQQFMILIIAIVIGFAAIGGSAISALSKLEVNGPLYQNIVQGKDLIADILPPPEYILESYFVILRMEKATPAERENLTKQFAALHKDFNDRFEYWSKQTLTL